MSDPASRIALLVYDDVELMDVAGPYEVFTTAARMAARPEAAGWPGSARAARWQVACVARTAGAVRARAGLRLWADHGFDDAPPADLLVVPGGVADAAAACPHTQAWVRTAATQARHTMSVCTGAFILAAAGVLRDGPVTTHWEDADELRTRWPALDVRPGLRWTDQDRLLTSAGICAGIDLALHLVARRASPALAERTARQMDHRWLREPA